jgi:DNA-binding transcriptional LysR family regulator
MTLWQLKTFATVARERSFTKAGKALNISQPSVSSLVIGLQKELGIKLFEKLGMKPHLTEAGRRVLQLVESALAIIEKIPQEIDEVKGRHRLRIGGSALAAASFLPVAVQEFKKHHPEVDIVLKIERTDSLEKNLLEGELDLAILGWAPRSSLLAREPYREEEVCVIAPPNHPLTKKRFVSLELLMQQPLILQGRNNPIREMVEKKVVAKGLSLIRRLEVNDEFGGRDIIRSAVTKGLGIGFVSKCHVLGDVAARRLKVLTVPELKLKRTMYIVLHKRREVPASTQGFIRFLKKYKYKE